jgi:hypothetical protein
MCILSGLLNVRPFQEGARLDDIAPEAATRNSSRLSSGSAMWPGHAATSKLTQLSNKYQK